MNSSQGFKPGHNSLDLFSANKKTLVFLEAALRRLQVRGLVILKIKESRQIFVGMTEVF
jgi:hypothetical protein